MQFSPIANVLDARRSRPAVAVARGPAAGLSNRRIECIMEQKVQAMQIELSREEAELLRDRLQQQVKELDKEINRTESREFKRALQADDRAMERILGRLAVALEERRE